MHKFEATGSFQIDPTLPPYEDGFGNVIGFTRPDGSIVRLVIGLEVERPDGSFQYVTAEREMENLGFSMLDYERLDFYPTLPNPSKIES